MPTIHQIKTLYSCRVWKGRSFFSCLSTEKTCSALHRSREGSRLQKSPKASPWGIHIPGLLYSCLYRNAFLTDKQTLSWEKKRSKSVNDNFGIREPKDRGIEESMVGSLGWRKLGTKQSRGGPRSYLCWKRKTGKSMKRAPWWGSSTSGRRRHKGQAGFCENQIFRRLAELPFSH